MYFCMRHSCCIVFSGTWLSLLKHLRLHFHGSAATSISRALSARYFPDLLVYLSSNGEPSAERTLHAWDVHSDKVCQGVHTESEAVCFTSIHLCLCLNIDTSEPDRFYRLAFQSYYSVDNDAFTVHMVRTAFRFLFLNISAIHFSIQSLVIEICRISFSVFSLNHGYTTTSRTLWDMWAMRLLVHRCCVCVQTSFSAGEIYSGKLPTRRSAEVVSSCCCCYSSLPAPWPLMRWRRCESCTVASAINKQHNSVDFSLSLVTSIMQM